MYIEASSKSPNDTARLVSAPVNLDIGGMCLKFWYHMWGPNVYQLNVYAKQSKYNTDKHIVNIVI